jgi:two-component system, response regulator PdtaR
MTRRARTEPPAEPPTVLVVEDEPLVQVLAREGLEDAGFRVLPAWTAEEALRVLEEQADHIQVLFTDVDMPGRMDGLGLAEEVHRRWPHIVLLLASGYARPSEEAIPDEGHFVPKPYTSRVIVEHINALMQGRSGA